VLVTATSAVVAALIIGLVISTSLYLRMRQALNTVSQLENKVEVDSKLSTAQRLYAEGRYQAALNEIEVTLDAQNLGPKAQLLRAQLLVEMGQLKDAETQLLPLTKAGPEIAGAAYYLLARINMGIDESKASEYEALAASMLPETAEAYSLRAMTSTSPDQALQWLDMAITLDPAHYPSLKTRVLTYYGIGEVQKMVEDVGALVALRPADSLGYAIRALLRLESGRFEEATMDLTRAIDLCENKTELSELYQQRYETYAAMGDHASALADARYSAELDPQTLEHRIQIFRSLLAIKDFAAAKREYRSIVQTSHQWGFRFNQAAACYVFDILSEGQTFAIPPDMVQQAPFAQMQRAAQCYYSFESKATLLLSQQRQGFMLYGWSPDGKELLCGCIGFYGGITEAIRRSAPSIDPGNLGLKIINIESGQERHITSNYTESAAWSPDGEYIAFPDPNRNICIVLAEGGQPRKLASGTFPQWSQDSQHLYFKTAWRSGDVCVININDPDPIPKKLMKCPGRFVINEDENWIAFEKPTGIDIVDLSSGSLLYQYRSPWPLFSWGLSLSPNGRELCFRTWWSSVNIGPLILDTQDKQLYRVFDYPIDNLFRSPDCSKLVIGARPKAWIMEVDPNIPICQILGQKIPGNDLITDQIERKSQAIAADPLYPENYLKRALAYISFGQRQNAESDMRQFDALVTSDDHHVGYEIFWWLRQCYFNQLYEEAELLAPYAEKLMDRFPADIPSYRDLIEESAEKNESNGKIELAQRLRAKLRDLDNKDE
jgi:tetratricopeptide (TPR) repeat protein/Tol biopolymer transport system component